jgi:hypothetical protein
MEWNSSPRSKYGPLVPKTYNVGTQDPDTGEWVWTQEVRYEPSVVPISADNLDKVIAMLGDATYFKSSAPDSHAAIHTRRDHVTNHGDQWDSGWNHLQVDANGNVVGAPLPDWYYELYPDNPHNPYAPAPEADVAPEVADPGSYHAG